MFAGATAGEVYKKTFELLSEENDRGAVLLSGVITDGILDEMIKSRLIGLPSARVGKLRFQYAAKIDMAFSLGMISLEMLTLLHSLRDARNTFAHKIVNSLDDAAISKAIKSVFDAVPSLYDGFMSSWIANLQSTLRGVGIVDETLIASVSPGARARFNNYLALVAARLHEASAKVEKLSFSGI
ncbi:hypothetical protein CXQ80_02810 [Pseudomonas sp. 02C 26]|uniref:hypothetical protein n=1 Tax=Pseudomonas sp. 02C 26 TaxID=2054914 RepID=UPI000C6CABCD|nr:hypothetical protein [Pseudomonas sp. 02C 26]AUF94825.1 hypothetical protein CXQ80_02810 [Pseudomonas sp. 02C 26]